MLLSGRCRAKSLPIWPMQLKLQQGLQALLLLSLMLLAGGLPAAQAAPEAEGAGDGAAAVASVLERARSAAVGGRKP